MTDLISATIEQRQVLNLLGHNLFSAPIEIIPDTGFYDYKSKYQAGLTREICPADITEKQDKILQVLI